MRDLKGGYGREPREHSECNRVWAERLFRRGVDCVFESEESRCR
jgi:hypothetical protein